jgi:transcriptional regulator with XRE-family HTH domain
VTHRQEVGNRIAQARREKGVRERRDVLRADLAEAVGVDPSTITAWEKGLKSPREEVLAKLAAYLGVTPEFLRYGIRAPRVELTDEEIAAAMARSAARRKAQGLPPIVADETIEGPDVVDDPPPPKQAAAAGRKRPKRPRDAR